MPECNRCNKWLPPDFFDVDEGQQPKLCLFCHRNINEIYYGEGKLMKYTKEDAVKDYETFLKMMDAAPGPREVIDLMKNPPDRNLVKVYR